MQAVGFLEAFGEFAGQALHLLVEWFVVLFLVGDTDVSAGRQNVVLFGDVLDGHRGGEPFLLFQGPVTECVECGRDPLYVFVGERAL